MSRDHRDLARVLALLTSPADDAERETTTREMERLLADDPPPRSPTDGHPADDWPAMARAVHALLDKMRPILDRRPDPERNR